MVAEEAAFWAAIAAAPHDDLPKLTFADWLDDRSDRRAACLRWVVQEKKQPAYDRMDMGTWDWWSRVPTDPLFYKTPSGQYVLPSNLFTRLMPFGPGIWKHQPTFDDALGNLCAAWAECVHEGVDPLAGDRPRSEPDAGLAETSPTNV